MQISSFSHSLNQVTIFELVSVVQVVHSEYALLNAWISELAIRILYKLLGNWNKELDSVVKNRMASTLWLYPRKLHIITELLCYHRLHDVWHIGCFD